MCNLWRIHALYGRLLNVNNGVKFELVARDQKPCDVYRANIGKLSVLIVCLKTTSQLFRKESRVLLA